VVTSFGPCWPWLRVAKTVANRVVRAFSQPDPDDVIPSGIQNRYDLGMQIRGDSRRSGCRAFTLVELMVVVSIIAILIGILAPTIRGAMARARAFKCQMAQRSVAFDFAIFADPELHGDRGDDGNRNTFFIETFQESQYGVDEFWRWGEHLGSIELPDAQGNDPMRCPEVRVPMRLRSDLACSNGAVGPAPSVSFAFNARLHRAEITDSRGRPRAVQVPMRPDILGRTDVPLLLDVDGVLAGDRGVNPVFIAPALDSLGPYADNRLWYPGLRHSGKANVAFIDGHVESSSSPDREKGWDWAYQPGS